VSGLVSNTKRKREFAVACKKIAIETQELWRLIDFSYNQIFYAFDKYLNKKTSVEKQKRLVSRAFKDSAPRLVYVYLICLELSDHVVPVSAIECIFSSREVGQKNQVFTKPLKNCVRQASLVEECTVTSCMSYEQQ
jgi:hypothetical protein